MSVSDEGPSPAVSPASGALPQQQAAPSSQAPGTAATGPAPSSGGSASNAIQPGWYPDPSDPEHVRYFDGAAWTSAVVAGVASPTCTVGPAAPYPRLTPGWYDNPSAPGHLAFFDGSAWVPRPDALRPHTAAPAAPWTPKQDLRQSGTTPGTHMSSPNQGVSHRTSDAALHWDGVRWLRWDGHQWIDTTTGSALAAAQNSYPVALNDVWAWTLAVIPLLYGPFNLVTGWLFVLVAIGINSLLMSGDLAALKKAGYTDRPSMGWVVLVPVYLFIRGQRTGQGPIMGIVSIVTVALSMVGL